MAASHRLAGKWHASLTTTTPTFPSSVRRLWGGVSNTKVLLDLYLRLSWTRCPRGRDYVQGERLCACERVTRKVVSGNTCSSGWTKWSLKATGSHCKLLSQAGFVQNQLSEAQLAEGDGDRLGEEWVLTGHLPSPISPALCYLRPHSNSVSRTGLLLPSFLPLRKKRAPGRW